jgi:Fic family protein
MYKIVVDDWRSDTNGPMQVISGPMGNETVHFEAPEAKTIPNKMKAFIAWMNKATENDAVLNAAIAHLWFLTNHPFEDGNGRIARAITDLLLCRSEQKTQRFYSISAQIKKQKKSYYEILESSQKGDLDITAWLSWFLDCMEKAIAASSEIVQKIMSKHKFWDDHKLVTFNDRQLKILELLLSDFFDNLTTSKWAKLNKCSSDTALRDIQDLMDKKVLTKSDSGGRSTNYELIK